MTVLKYWDATSASYKTLIGAGVGVLPGGTTGQVLTKSTATDYDTYWSGPYLPLTGGTLSGTLVVQSTVQVNTANTAILNLNKASGANSSSVYGQSGASNRWVMMLGNSATESGSNVGSDFNLNRYSDAGAFIDTPLTITRSTGQVTLSQQLNIVPASGDGIINIAPSGWPTIQWSTTGPNPYTYSMFLDNNKTFYFRDVTRGNVNVFTVGSTGMLTLPGLFNPSGGIVGVNDGSSATAGRLGEIISSIVASPGITLTTSVAANVTSISLTAGDWDLYGEVWIALGTGGAGLCAAGASPNSAGLGAPSANNSRASLCAAFTASNTQIMTLPTSRQSLAATTTMYLVAYCVFPSGTVTAYGRIAARRVR